MRSRLIELRAALVAMALVASAAACVIGPKQDDPITAAPISDTGINEFGDDTGTSSDTSGGKENDASIVADTAPFDTAAVDSSPSDTSVFDSPPSDTSVFDAPPSDASTDVGPSDAGDVDPLTDAVDVDGG